MAITWDVEVLGGSKNHVITVIFRETDGAYKETYSISVSPEGTPAERKQRVLAELKTQVLKRRAIRQRIEAIKNALSSQEIEAFINS